MQDCCFLLVSMLTNESQSNSHPQIHACLPFCFAIFAFFFGVVSPFCLLITVWHVVATFWKARTLSECCGVHTNERLKHRT